jgi:hypothetical protein
MEHTEAMFFLLETEFHSHLEQQLQFLLDASTWTAWLSRWRLTIVVDVGMYEGGKKGKWIVEAVQSTHCET